MDFAASMPLSSPHGLEHLRSFTRRMICATIPIQRSQHAPPNSVNTRLFDARCGLRNSARPTAYTAATEPSERTNRLCHKDRKEISSCHLPLPVQEQDPHVAERCQGAGIDCLERQIGRAS